MRNTAYTDKAGRHYRKCRDGFIQDVNGDITKGRTVRCTSSSQQSLLEETAMENFIVSTTPMALTMLWPELMKGSEGEKLRVLPDGKNVTVARGWHLRESFSRSSIPGEQVPESHSILVKAEM